MTDDYPHDATRTIRIPERTADAIADRLAITEFESVDEYVAFTMELVVRELEQGEVEEPPTAGDPGDHEEVRDQLEKLGYL